MSIRNSFLWIAAGGAAVYTVLRELRKQDGRLSAIEAQQAALQIQIRDEGRNLYRQMQAITWLHDQFEFNVPLPPMRGWAASPDFAALLVTLIREHTPQTVVELGGGTSTILTAKTLRELREGHVYAVEALEPFANSAHANLQQHGLDDIATVIHAPITRVNAGERALMWYDMDELEALPEIDMLVVDGPAQYSTDRRMVRYPALPMLYNKLSPDALIVMDDTLREDERIAAERWLAEFPDLRQIAEYTELEKGALVFKRGS
ncbi:MAG: class I SAM-dependent methyltransferase [Chloroflexota bacterium]